MSERLVKDDVYTSIPSTTTIRSSWYKLGPEELLVRFQTLGEDALKNLDADGIIRIGAGVKMATS